MWDDFNTPKAFSYLFGIFKNIQKKLADNNASVVADYNGVKRAYKILGLFVNKADEFISFVNNKTDSDIPQEVINMAEERWQAKKERNFAKADELRAKLLEMGYEILDSKDGYKINKSNA